MAEVRPLHLLIHSAIMRRARVARCNLRHDLTQCGLVVTSLLFHVHEFIFDLAHRHSPIFRIEPRRVGDVLRVHVQPVRDAAQIELEAVLLLVSRLALVHRLGLTIALLY